MNFVLQTLAISSNDLQEKWQPNFGNSNNTSKVALYVSKLSKYLLGSRKKVSQLLFGCCQFEKFFIFNLQVGGYFLYYCWNSGLLLLSYALRSHTLNKCTWKKHPNPDTVSKWMNTCAWDDVKRLGVMQFIWNGCIRDRFMKIINTCSKFNANLSGYCFTTPNWCVQNIEIGLYTAAQPNEMLKLMKQRRQKDKVIKCCNKFQCTLCRSTATAWSNKSYVSTAFQSIQ